VNRGTAYLIRGGLNNTNSCVMGDFRKVWVGVLSAIVVIFLLTAGKKAHGLSANYGQGVVVVVLDSADLTEREEAILSIFSDYGLTPDVLSSSSADFSDLEQYSLITATEDPTLTQATINDLVENGRNVWLLYNAGLVLGGDWRSGGLGNNRRLRVEDGADFLEGYRSNLSFEVQSSSSAFAIRSGVPAGWSVLGESTASGSNATALSREHPSGGKGIIYTYDPSGTSQTGRNIYDLMYEWLEGEPAHPGKTVPADHAAFVISNYDDDADGALDLTEEENALYDTLLGYGYEVTFIRFSRLGQSDLSEASLVTAATYPSVDPQTVSAQLSAGTNVALLYSSAAVLGGDWRSGGLGNNRRLRVEDGADFLEGYRSNLSFEVQSSSSAFAIRSGVPAGWSVLGESTASGSNATALSREHPSGGKGIIYTYDPSGTSQTGRNIYDLMYEWLEGEPAHPGKTVPADHAAFVISNYDDDADGALDLTEEENALYDTLLGYGYEVTFIRFSRLGQSDLSEASLVTAATYPSVDPQTVSAQLSAGTNVALLYSSAAVLGGDWRSGGLGNNRRLRVEDGADFLRSYTVDDQLTVQNTGSAFAIRSDYPADWSILGRNTSGSSNRTVFSFEEFARGAIYTYDPSRQTAEGNAVIDELIEWLEEGATVPTFYKAENGITILCPDAEVGDSGEVDGTVYTKRDRAGLNSLVEEGAGDIEFATTCTSDIEDMSGLFESAESVNPDVSTWDVSSVTDMGGMFFGTTSFDQDIGAWDVSSVEAFESMHDEETRGFLEGVTIDAPNYDALLSGWSERDLVPNIRFDAGDSQYTEDAIGARQSIIDTFNWTIRDGGQTAPEIMVDPIVLDFEDVEVGSATEKILTLENTGQALLEGAVTSTGASDFKVDDAGAFMLNPGDMLELLVDFAPTRGGVINGQLTIEHNAVNTDSPSEIELIGQGTVATQVPVSASRAFGDPSVETSYRLVGLPGQIDADLAATLSGESGSAWRAFRETGAEGDDPEAYLDEYDGSDAFRFAPGRGFWLLSRDAWEVDQTVDAVELTDDGFTSIPLHDGWNIFSNPLDRPVAWDVTLSLDANDGLTEALWQWDGAWAEANSFESARTGEAYYLFNDGDLDELTLQHPVFVDDGEQGDLIAATQAERAELQLIAETRSSETDERQESARLALGHTAGDVIMHRLPPARFAAAQLSVRSEALDAPLGRLLKAASEEGLAFDVELTGIVEGEAAYLYSEGLSAFEGEEVVLVHAATGARHSLVDYSAAEPLRIRVQEGHLTRGSNGEKDTLPLQLLIGDQAFVDGAAERPDELAFGAVYPNPAAGEVTIEVAVPEAMALQVELYNVLGQQVSLLYSGELAPGVHELHWDGRTSAGMMAASGVYLVRLMGPDGQQDTARLARVR